MCVAKGLNLQTNTLVTKVTSTDNGKWVVHTPRGTTICGKVVYCTNGYTKGLLEEFSNTIVPQRGVCCSIEAADKDHTPHLTNTYGLFTSRPNSDYLINRPDGTIIVGGRDESLIKPNGDISGWFDCVDDTYVDEVSKAEFKDYMKKRFSTWENTDSDVSKIWSGILGFTNDYLPYVGELDVIGKKGCYIVAGFHGHGMPRVLFSAKAVATCITQNKKVHELEYTIPKGFFVSKERIEKPNVYEQGIHKFVKEHYDAKL
ncbi:FAD dependent oxidoreductase [Yamadazyma tenuis ATCC 10573]|nr:FAD dependent oxidoreductase [Yamadazyma tenuis ATCC 10573]EGV66062.1 FAD dependent oxidoreductase [Yamadazyma tenuis ATCC 10573]